MILPIIAALVGPPQQQPPERWMLFYAGYPKGGRAAYTVQDFVRLVAVVDTTGKPIGWLSTGGIFLQILATSGRGFFPHSGSGPANGADWAQYLDSLAGSSGALLRLDSAIALVEQQLGPIGRPFAVVPMIPYPDTTADTLTFEGKRYNLRAPVQRSSLALAYASALRGRFRSAHYRHLELAGFYWFREDVPAQDSAVVTATATGIHSEKERFFWIPFYRAASREKWKALGFDAAWLQPNFFFHRDVAEVRLDSAATEASTYGLGLEIEFDRRLLNDPAYQDRLGPYLAVMNANPTLKGRGVAIYDGAGALIELSEGKSPWQRVLYNRFVATVTGRAE